MKVNVQAVNFNVDRKLVDFIQERLDKLEKYYDKIVSADVFLKVEKTSDKENKFVEIKINVPGDDFLVKKQCKTFEEAVELSAESLERVLVKRKEKIRDHI
jgi:putative sigma-54 modulation protein